MVHDVKKADFDALMPEGAEIRPIIAEQVRKFLASSDYTDERDTDIAKAESFLKSVERAGYARKISKSNEPTANSAPYASMLKNWGRKDAGTDLPAPKGDEKFAQGVFYYFFRHIANPAYFIAVAKQVWKPHDLTFQRLYYAKYHHDPKNESFAQVSARFHAESRVVRREFEKIWIDTQVGVSPKVHLGPITIVLGDEDNLNRLSLQEPVGENFLTDGMPDIFKALDWRSRLSGFYGRQDDIAHLKEWANDASRTLKVMLVSGPGGAGKTRLAADAVAHLVHNQGWRGGFLGDANRPIDGNGAGVAVIIDDPEERTRLVSEILKASALALKNGETFDRMVRIILVSREGRDAWGTILNEPATFIEEIRLDPHPHLEIEDALAIAGDIAIEYPARLGREACDFSGARSWLERDAAHRLPLNVVAASVHAVLDPSRAFKLDGSGILTTLAEWELRRVRYYSERNLGDRGVLEKLLGLSVLTRLGLTKWAIFELGEQGICPGKSGDRLLEAIRQTPYWQASSNGNQSHLKKLEPDRPAAIFCLKTLRLDDPSPGLPRWLIPAATQDVDGFGERLNRLSFDIGQLDPTASRNVEQQCIEMLDLQPALISQFRGIAGSYLPVFSATFAMEICRRLLRADDGLDDDNRATIANSLANMLSDLGQHEAALDASKEVVLICRRLAASGSPAFLEKLANSLNNQSCVLAELLERNAALQAIEEAVLIYRKLTVQGFHHVLTDLAMTLSNQGARLSDVERHKEALEAINEAVLLNRQLTKAKTGVAFHRLAGSLNNQANRLAHFERHEEALEAAQEAVSIHRMLADAQPDVFLQNLALTLNTLSQQFFALGQHKAAIGAMYESVTIYRRLANLRPEAFLDGLERALTNMAYMLVDFGHKEIALRIICEAIDEYRQQSGARIHLFLLKLANSLLYVAHKIGHSPAALMALNVAVSIYQQLAAADPINALPELAKALNERANRLSEFGEHKMALEAITEAVTIFRTLANNDQEAFQVDMASALVNQADTLSSLGRHEEALNAIDDAISVFQQLVEVKPDTVPNSLAKALNNKADTLSLVGQHEAALQVIDEAILLSRDSGAVDPGLATWTHTKANILINAGHWAESRAASTEAIATLRPYFLREPNSHPAMVTMVRLYLHVCEQGSCAPDMELLQPILDRFKSA